MKGNPVLYKSLVVAVLVLFIGIGIQPAFAVDETYEEENSSPIPAEVYTNSNCIVIGKAYRCLRLPTGIFKKAITFGQNTFDDGWLPSKGWIYTKGNEGEWRYEGWFYGRIDFVPLVPGSFVIFIGIQNFHGYAFFTPFSILDEGSRVFIGYAEQVIISPNHM